MCGRNECKRSLGRDASLQGIILFFLLFSATGGIAGIIIDHTAVEMADRIPDYYIVQVKKMLVNIPGESHRDAYERGLLLLASTPGYEKYAAKLSTIPEEPTDTHLRISPRHRNQDNTDWIGWSGEEHFWTSQAAVDMMKQHLVYMKGIGNPVHAFGFAWCWDMSVEGNPDGGIDPVYYVRWAGRTYLLDGTNRGQWGLDQGDVDLTNNPITMENYLAAVDAYNSVVPQTTAFFTTGPVDRMTGEAGYQRFLKHEFIRNYVRNRPDKILFDYADILTHDEDGTQNLISWTDHQGRERWYPFITPTNLGDESVGHIGEAGAIRLAKAIWVMMARLAGWNGCAAVPGDINGDCVVDVSDCRLMTDAWMSEYDDPDWNPVCDLAPVGGDGIIDSRDFSALSTHWLKRSCPGSLVTDFTNDCKVDLEDLMVFSESWMSAQVDAHWNHRCDVAPSGGDGLINNQDFSVFSTLWVRISCPNPSPVDVSNDCIVDLEDLTIFADSWMAIPGDVRWNPKCNVAVQGADEKINLEDLAIFGHNWPMK